jgi:hypothetical protein
MAIAHRHSRSAVSSLRIVVLGYMIRGPLGGLAWHYLQYLIGLANLGHDVFYVEDSDDYPACYNPSRNVTDTDPTYGLRFTARAFDRLGLGERWAYYDAHTERWLGPGADNILDVCRSADLVLNVSGVNVLRPWLSDVPVRVLVDTDPAFTQIRHLTDPIARRRALQHTAFFSFGENIDGGSSDIPDDGVPWLATRQPVALDAWPATPGQPQGRLTTVMQWSSYPPREYQGQHYGMKSDSFGPYADLPEQVGPIFQLSLGGSGFDEEMASKWGVQDSRLPTRDPWTYQRYIQNSKAEFSVAKHGYVVSRSGWFSERSAAYLASGRPVIVQDTGFTAWLAAGVGVLAFGTPDEALTRIEEVNSRYELHCQAARGIAEGYFDARQVLPHLIERAMASSPPV